LLSLSSSQIVLRSGRKSGVTSSDVQKLKRLEEENSKLKRVVADLTLDNVVLKDLLGKNF